MDIVGNRLCLVVFVGAAGWACGGSAGPRVIPTLERVILTPETASLSPGGTQPFQVGGVQSDGSPSTPAVTYSATGGAITASGLYTAGNQGGGFRVVATQVGGSLADTATVTIASSRTYTTTFPLTENPLSEGGNWRDGGTVGLDWTNVSTALGRATGLQCCASYTDATALLTGSWGADQTATATVYATNPLDDCYQEVELRLRSALSAHRSTGYEISFKSSQTSAAYLIIVRWNGPLGDFTYLVNEHGTQYAVKTGDVISAQIVGTVITAYKNGVQMGQATDNTYAGGNPGMGFNLETKVAGCAGTNGDYGYTTFTATDSG
jgi:hypothetical protein